MFLDFYGVTTEEYVQAIITGLYCLNQINSSDIGFLLRGKASLMRFREKYEHISDQALVERIQTLAGSQGDSVEDLPWLKLEYSRRVRDAQDLTPFNPILSAFGIGFGLPLVSLLSLRSLSARLVLFCLVFGVILTLFLLASNYASYALDQKEKRRGRCKSLNGFKIRKADPNLVLSPKEAIDLLDRVDRLSDPELYYLLSLQVAAPFGSKARHPPGSAPFLARFYGEVESHFSKENDADLYAMLSSVSIDDSPEVYGLIKLEFERRNPIINWKYKFLGLIFAVIFAVTLSGFLYLFFSENLSVSLFVIVGLFATAMSYLGLGRLEQQKRAYFKGLRKANPPGFALDPRDPVYELSLGEYKKLEKVLHASHSLSKADSSTLIFHANVRGYAVPVALLVAIIVMSRFIK